MRFEEALGSGKDMSNDESGAERVDDVFVIRVEE